MIDIGQHITTNDTGINNDLEAITNEEENGSEFCNS